VPKSKIVKRINFYSLIFFSLFFSFMLAVREFGPVWKPLYQGTDTPVIFIASMTTHGLLLFIIPLFIGSIIPLIYRYINMIFNRHIDTSLSYIIVWIVFIFTVLVLIQAVKHIGSQAPFKVYVKSFVAGCVQEGERQYAYPLKSNQVIKQTCVKVASIIRPILHRCYENRNKNNNKCRNDMKKLYSCINGNRQESVLKSCVSKLLSENTV